MAEVIGRGKSFLSTLREDRWWISPMLVLFGLLSFIVYSTWAAWQGEHFWWSGEVNADGFGGYLSPFYSPTFFIDITKEGIPPISHTLGHIFGGDGLWPDSLDWLPGHSPAWLILIFPLSFRFTCYYYRKAYYRAFTFSPPACAVGGIPQKEYKGETGILWVQNFHRYAMYFAIIFIFLLAFDGIQAFFRNGEFGVGVGSIILLINPILLGGYTFGCHSFRHLIGGRMDCFSCSHSAEHAHSKWKIVTYLNRRHQMFAWLSLVWVGLSDGYVRLVSMGVITDLNTWGI